MADAISSFGVIEQLIDLWCDRRALGPLRLILPFYPLHSPHSDGWFDLYRALKDVKISCKEELSQEERGMLQAVMSDIADALDRQNGKGSWHV